MSYQPNIPTGRVVLLSDYKNVLGNFQQLEATFGVDHLPFSNTSPQFGYHTSIHMVPQTSITNTPGYGQLFSKTINDETVDQALFWDTGTGNIPIQLTANFPPTLAINGYTFLAGGLIIQWGLTPPITIFHQKVTFSDIGNIEFPNNCYNVQIALTNTTTNFGFNAAVNTLEKDSFFLDDRNFGASNNQFYFIAIGN